MLSLAVEAQCQPQCQHVLHTAAGDCRALGGVSSTNAPGADSCAHICLQVLKTTVSLDDPSMPGWSELANDIVVNEKTVRAVLPGAHRTAHIVQYTTANKAASDNPERLLRPYIT
jgi:hypothetical protein